jgi:hypothetical protein
MTICVWEACNTAGSSDTSRPRRQECWNTRAKDCNRYDSRSRHRYSHVFAGHDVGVCAHGIEAIAPSLARLPQDVAASVDATIVSTDSRRQRFSLAVALGVSGVSLQLAGHIDAWRDMARREEQLAEKVDLPLQRGLGLFNLDLAQVGLW